MLNKEQKTKLKNISSMIQQLKKEGETWRVDDENRAAVIKWIYAKGLTDCDSLEDLRTLCDNCIVCTSNAEILNADNVNEYDGATVLRLTRHTTAYIKKLGNKRGFLLHYPIIKNGNCTIIDSVIKYNLKELEEKPIKKPARFVVIGAKWFDGVNGNTYNNAKIIDIKTCNRYYAGYKYGYGNSYLYSARDYIKEHLKKDVDIVNDIIDGGSFYINKKDCKMGAF